jgi:hypothetical protein
MQTASFIALRRQTYCAAGTTYCNSSVARPSKHRLPVTSVTVVTMTPEARAGSILNSRSPSARSVPEIAAPSQIEQHRAADDKADHRILLPDHPQQAERDLPQRARLVYHRTCRASVASCG